MDGCGDRGLLREEGMASRETLSELDLLNEIADAAADADKIMAALIKSGDLTLASTDIGAAALMDRLNRLNAANRALRAFRSSRPE